MFASWFRLRRAGEVVFRTSPGLQLLFREACLVTRKQLKERSGAKRPPCLRGWLPGTLPTRGRSCQRTCPLFPCSCQTWRRATTYPYASNLGVCHNLDAFELHVRGPRRARTRCGISNTSPDACSMSMPHMAMGPSRLRSCFTVRGSTARAMNGSLGGWRKGEPLCSTSIGTCSRCRSACGRSRALSGSLPNLPPTGRATRTASRSLPTPRHLR